MFSIIASKVSLAYSKKNLPNELNHQTKCNGKTTKYDNLTKIQHYFRFQGSYIFIHFSSS